MMKYVIKVENTEVTREWKLLEDFVISNGYMVHKGFVFDGASIPVGLRWLFPHGGAKFPAACAHDYLYRTGVVTRKEADQVFYDMMIDNGVPKWKAKAMHTGLKVGGGFAWRSRRKNDNVTG